MTLHVDNGLIVFSFLTSVYFLFATLTVYSVHGNKGVCKQMADSCCGLVDPHSAAYA